MNVLDSKGTCQKCKKDAQMEFIECWICKHKYHVIDCEGEEPMVQPSFLKNQWPNIARKWSCITFTCHNCREDINTKQDHIMSQRLRLMEEMYLKCSKQLDGITESLSIKDQDGVVNHGKSYASVAAESPSLIVVEKGNEEPSEQETKTKMEELKRAAIESRANIKKAYTNKSGKTVVLCHNEKSKEVILPHVTKLFSERKVNTPKPKLPTISVPFIDGGYEKDELISALKSQNEDNGLVFNAENTQVLFISPMKDQSKEGLHQAVLRVSEEMREKIQVNGNRIFLGARSCPVYDRFYVKRCNKCQSFHHFHKDCRKNVVCARCAGSHDTRACKEDDVTLKCINCSVAGFEDTAHSASSYDCPAYIAEQDRLKKSIFYYSKNY